MKKKELTQEERDCITKIDEQIDHMVDEKVILNFNQNPKNPLDKNKVRTECENIYFQELGEGLEKDINKTKDFMDLIKVSKPEIYTKFKQHLNEILEQQKNKGLTDLTELNKPFLSDTELNELFQEGISHFEKDEYHPALSYFTMLIFLQPKNADFWLLRGMTEQNLNNFDDALVNYYQTILLNPNHLLACLQVIDCMILQNNFKEAKRVFDFFIMEIDHSIYANDPALAKKVETINSFLNEQKQVI